MNDIAASEHNAVTVEAIKQGFYRNLFSGRPIDDPCGSYGSYNGR